jgi:hypothetical protein
MKTLIDPYELLGCMHDQSGVRESAPSPRASIDLEVAWEEEREEQSSPGVPSETWNRARGWASDDV